MKHRHRILRITRYQLIQLIRNPRLYMIVICNFIFLSTLMSSLRTFLEMHQLKATPFLFSFLFIHPSVIFCFLAGVALLFSNAPFFNRSQMYLTIRTGKIVWAVGQICYIILGSVLYFLMLYLMSLIFLFPHISFRNEWGNVWNTLARTDAGLNSGIPLQVPVDILNQFKPLEALGWTCMMGILNAVLIGLVLFFCNLFLKREVGIAAAMLVILAPYRLSFMPTPVHYLATAAWLDPSYLFYSPTYRGPDAIQQILILSVLITILFLGCIYGILHKDLPEVEE